ncbi:MAG: ATP-binding cassette domain-containing protein [Nonlabens sp.]|jgi:ABC-type multidrug transport system ATPase subunit|uniref:ATP-binding cassette domain-containing protein n=2 Tax=Nonlabens sp. TaxID=1888209 RepID=UPI00321A6855
MSSIHVHINSYQVGGFKKTTLLNNLELNLNTGEIIGLLGRNGCGKSSLMNVIFGKYKADCIAHFDGKPIQLRNHLKHELVAYLPQDPFMVGSGSVVDAVQMWYPNPEDQDKILYEPLIHKVHHVKVKALSIGERRFLEFLLIIYTNRSFILLDEPFSMLAPLQIERVKKIITAIQPNKGILISDHYYENVLQLANSSFVLKDSKFIPVEDEEDLKRQLYI